MVQPSLSASVRPSASEPTKLAGRYVLLDTLGTGGMGAVHRARDEATGKIVAFKQLSVKRTGGKQRALQALFEREFHTLARLKHPRIIEAYDYGLCESGPYYTMELLDGADLQQLAPLPYRDACRYLRDVASSLALIHAQRLVHRDVSPRNVRLTQDGRAKLIDFGALAPFGPTPDVVGTPVCMAPEILRRMPIDQRTDLYALGAVAYWALTGQHAFPARNFNELPELWQRPPNAPSKLVAGIPPGLDALVLALLSMDPLSRPSSAAAVIDQLTMHAELPPEEHDHAGDSYLSSGRMVGRDEELRWVHRRVVRALEGRGAEMLVEGPMGVGKTRLMHEVCLDAQLRGVVVLKADAQAAPGFFGVAATLAAGLLASCGSVARRAAEPHEQLLSHLSPELQE
ncbi:MAG TPA: serine/threonine-protein kinase, partial [Polyangiales bacterium]|nr:serine/threonine-protein kinase [Polyangiales bacterium]